MPRWTQETLTLIEMIISGVYFWVVTSFRVIENRMALVIQRLGVMRFKYIINPGTLAKSGFQQFNVLEITSGKKSCLT